MRLMYRNATRWQAKVWGSDSSLPARAQSSVPAPVLLSLVFLSISPCLAWAAGLNDSSLSFAPTSDTQVGFAYVRQEGSFQLSTSTPTLEAYGLSMRMQLGSDPSSSWTGGVYYSRSLRTTLDTGGFPAFLDATRLPLPVVVKPVDQGSSVATFIVRDEARFPGAVREVAGQFGRALVEQFIDGDEITVGILGDQALPPICVRPKRPFYDYQAKYQDDATEYLFDAGHPASLLEQARRQSLTVFAALGCRHLARVDWMADRDGRLWFLELNTIPGFTSHSLVPKAAARTGIPFDALCARLVEMAAASFT